MAVKKINLNRVYKALKLKAADIAINIPHPKQDQMLLKIWNLREYIQHCLDSGYFQYKSQKDITQWKNDVINKIKKI